MSQPSLSVVQSQVVSSQTWGQWANGLVQQGQQLFGRAVEAVTPWWNAAVSKVQEAYTSFKPAIDQATAFAQANPVPAFMIAVGAVAAASLVYCIGRYAFKCCCHRNPTPLSGSNPNSNSNQAPNTQTTAKQAGTV